MPNFSRKDMPQVKTQDLGKALSMVADKVKVTKETIVASKLKKAQKELYKDKVQAIANRFTSPNKMKPLIISKDNHIVDGHHRWGAAIYKWGDDVKLNVHRIHLSANNAIKLYKHIANTINEILENITIPIKVGDTVLGGKFKNKRIVVKSIDKNEKGDITINGKPLLKYRLVNEGNDQLEMMKLLSKAMKAMPGSPKQKKIKQELNKLRIKNGLEPIPESVLKEACWKGYKQVGGKKKGGKMVPNCVPIKKKRENVVPNHNGKSAPYGSGYKKKNEIYFDRFGNKCNNPTTLDGRCIDKYHPSTTIREPLSEIPMADLQKIDTFADKKLNPMDVVITDKHFFDRLNDPRNGKEISSAELIGFFKRLSKKKNEFVEFLNKYNSIVATDDRTNINIPFMKKANKAIAKTVMRKKDFKTPDKRLDI